MERITKEIIDEIKDKNDIVDVIGSYISLTDKNKALCPFHDDHTPSFSISSDKQIYKCFSCGESGNVITFVQKYNNISFIEALKLLADRAGIKLNINEQKNVVSSKFDTLYKINDTALKYFKNLLLSKEGSEARDYLSKRKIDKDIINEFNIGLSSSNKLGILLSSKYGIEDVIKSDIVKDINGKIYDTFQRRIIFPILDEKSNVIGFSGRKYLSVDLKDDTLPKYSNTRETVIFNKSDILYNINNALPIIKKKKEIIISEGFMDTIRLSSIGYKNVVSLMGTSFTSSHLEQIIKYKCAVVLNLDQDSAGKTATLNIGLELLKHNIEVSVIVFEDYKDCDEFIAAKGSDAFDTAYNNKISFIDFKLMELKNNKNMRDSLDISKYINEAINAINLVNDDILKELKIKELSKEFDIDESIIRSKIKNSINKKEDVKEVVKSKRYNKYDISEIRILYLMLHYEDAILYFENTLGYLIHEEYSSLAYRIIEFYNDYGYFNYSDFIDYIESDKDLNNTLKEVMKYPNEEEYTKEELDSYIDSIKEYSVKRRIDGLNKQINETLDVNKQIELLKKIENIKKEVLKW